jgi:hypothetical protein
VESFYSSLSLFFKINIYLPIILKQKPNNMKKTIILSSLLLVACTVITSCKKSSSNSSIVGNWELTSLHVVTVDSTTPVSVSTVDTTIAHGHSLVISFFADNTLAEYSFLSTPASIQSTGNYVVVGDSLTLFDGSTVQTVHFSVSGNSLTLNVNQSNPGSSSTSGTEKFNRQ